MAEDCFRQEIKAEIHLAANYLTLNGYTYKSGEIRSTNQGTTKESFTLDQDKIIYTWVTDGFRAIKVEFKGNLTYSSDGALSSGKVTDLTTAIKFIGNTEGDGEQITSYKVASQYSDISNFSLLTTSALALDGNGIASAVNFFYKSDAINNNTAPNPKYFPNSYWSNNRDIVTNETLPVGWWNSPFSNTWGGTADNLTGTAKKADVLTYTHTPVFGSTTSDKITNFNPKEKDKLQIQLSQFGPDAAGTFKVAKNAKALTKTLATSTDFIYLKSTGEFYYNENGTAAGYGLGGVFAVLEGRPNFGAKNIGFL